VEHYTTVIIGAGQAGLAMSHVLSESAVDHVILERGDVANSWRRDRWDSLRLLTPNWQSRLPGDRYEGPDPDGFMSMPQVISRLTGYANRCAMPIRTQTEVVAVRPQPGGYRIETTQGPFSCRHVVLASGACVRASVPPMAPAIPSEVFSCTALDYKRPSDLPDGGVLVVGGSATGVQIARELQGSGRQVILSLGEHIRAPRRYRGRDIKFWMDAAGLLDLDYRTVDDLERVRGLPSMQLVAGSERLDLNALQRRGVEVVGRLSMVRDGRALFSGGLANHCALADLKMNRLLETLNEWIAQKGAGEAPSELFEPTALPPAPRLDLDMSSGEIGSVLWATGYRPDFSWLDLPVFDRKEQLVHDGGVVTGAPGIYAMGLPFMRRRKSTLIDGAGDDARDLARHMLAQLGTRAAA
jgi:putative flavoprotein involved in K+ transport